MMMTSRMPNDRTLLNDLLVKGIFHHSFGISSMWRTCSEASAIEKIAKIYVGFFKQRLSLLSEISNEPEKAIV